MTALARSIDVKRGWTDLLFKKSMKIKGEGNKFDFTSDDKYFLKKTKTNKTALARSIDSNCRLTFFY